MYIRWDVFNGKLQKPCLKLAETVKNLTKSLKTSKGRPSARHSTIRIEAVLLALASSVWKACFSSWRSEWFQDGCQQQLGPPASLLMSGEGRENLSPMYGIKVLPISLFGPVMMLESAL